MTVPVKSALEEEVQLTYFLTGKKGKNSRLCTAELLDISNIGLCMKIPSSGSELYMESDRKLFLINRNIDIQIFCRSYPNNISLQGRVEWIKRESTGEKSTDEGNIYAGVLFFFPDGDQRKYVTEFVKLFRNHTISCPKCRVDVSSEVGLCYKCGARLVRKRTFLRSIINGIISGTGTTPKE
jgi:hypothetical protein